MSRRSVMKDISIGGYRIEGYKSGTNQVKGYATTEGELWFGTRRLCWFEDRGDGGGTHVDRDHENGLTESEWSKVQVDMKELFGLLGTNLHPEALARTFVDGVDQALEGWYTLIEELSFLVDYAVRAYPKVGPDIHYFIAMSGGGYTTEYTPDGLSMMAGRIAVKEQTIRAISSIVGHIGKESAPPGKQLVALAVLKGEIDWKLSLKEFADLYDPYSYLEDYK